MRRLLTDESVRGVYQTVKARQIIPAHSVLLRADGGEGPVAWRLFHSPRSIISATAVEDVTACLEELERAVAGGCHAAGFIAYEAAPAFDSALVTHSPTTVPLLWFGLYDRPETIAELPKSDSDEVPACLWESEMTGAAYLAAVERIRRYIAEGHTYQVNLTHRLGSRVQVEPYAFFRSLYRAQPVPHAAYLDLGRYVICSLSPELFFRLQGRRIISRPMKGTAMRGRWWEEDERYAAWLADSPKNRAENAMIVDMIRNDLGRIADKGSVEVEEVFRVERYRTLFQMTSTVAASPDFDDVLLWNERGEITESTIANVVIRLGDRLVTPPVSAGLLPGVFRERLLERQVIREEPVPLEALASATAVYLVNSVRGWVRASVHDPHGILRSDGFQRDTMLPNEEASSKPFCLDPR